MKLGDKNFAVIEEAKFEASLENNVMPLHHEDGTIASNFWQ